MQTPTDHTSLTARARLGRRAITATMLVLALPTALVACSVADATPRDAGDPSAVMVSASTTEVAAAFAGRTSTVIGCDGVASAKPTDMVFTCADGGVSMRGLTWSNWGGADAKATGTLDVNVCEPSCADGKQVSVNALVELSAPVEGDGNQVYSSAKITVAGATPAGVDRVETFELPTSR